MKTVLQIVVEYLQERRYDGLCNAEQECGCGMDDLAPCGNLGDDCRPAVAVSVTEADCPHPGLAPGDLTYIPVE